MKYDLGAFILIIIGAGVILGLRWYKGYRKVKKWQTER